MQIIKQIGSAEKKIENLMRNLTILLPDKLQKCWLSSHFHGQFATCGSWRQGCTPWTRSLNFIIFIIIIIVSRDLHMTFAAPHTGRFLIYLVQGCQTRGPSTDHIVITEYDPSHNWIIYWTRCSLYQKALCTKRFKIYHLMDSYKS
jgi:hypothetical protein